MKPVVSASDDGRKFFVLDADTETFGTFVDGVWFPRKAVTADELKDEFTRVSDPKIISKVLTAARTSSKL
jgi:hypothetical protein